MRSFRSHTMRLSVLLSALLVTFLLTLSIERYQKSGSELLQNPSFRNNLEFWKSRGDNGKNITVEKNGALRLYSPAKKYLSVSQKIDSPPKQGYVQLSARIRTTNVISGPKGWHKARLILNRYSASGQWQNIPHHAASISGTTRWQEYKQVFRLLPDTVDMYVTAGLAKASGSMEVRDPSLIRVTRNPLFVKVGALVFIVWGGLILWMLSFYITRRPKILILSMTLLTLVGIIAGTLAPAVSRARLQGTVKEYILEAGAELGIFNPPPSIHMDQDHPPYDVYIRHIEIGKIGHFILFGMLTFLLLASRSQIPIPIIISDVFLLSCVTELLQFFIEGRTTRLFDIALDLWGGLTGLLIFLAFFRLVNNSRPVSPVEDY